MSEMNKIQGTPWHVGRYTRSEGDERRHRSNCVYFRKKDKVCSQYLVECYGSAHCEHYKSKNEVKNENILEAVTKVRNDEAVRKFNQTNNIKIVEGMKIYRKKDGAFGTVTKVYWHENGSRYVIINFNGKDVEFCYDTVVHSDKFIEVPTRK